MFWRGKDLRSVLCPSTLASPPTPPTGRDPGAELHGLLGDPLHGRALRADLAGLGVRLAPGATRDWDGSVQGFHGVLGVPGG